jgi:hypothetical protein
MRARFSAPVQTGPGAHPASYTMGTSSFQGVKRPEHGVDQSPHLAPRLKKDQSYSSILPLDLRALFQGELHPLSFFTFLISHKFLEPKRRYTLRIDSHIRDSVIRDGFVSPK